MEVEDQQQPAEVENTIDDTLGDIFDKSMAEPGVEAVEETDEKPDRNRDEHGRFAKKDEPEAVDEPEVADEADIEVPVEAAETTGDAEKPKDVKSEDDFPFNDAPSTWKKDASAEFAALSPVVKSEIHRREEDFHRGIEQYREMAGIGQTLDKVIQPYANDIRGAGTNAPTLINDLLQTQKTLHAGSPQEKAAVVARILREYQIDTDTVNQLLEQPAPPPTDPQLANLTTTVQSLQQQLSQSQMAPFISQVDAFMDDPKNEYAETLQDDMQALLSTGRAKDLKDAYDKAKWANPDVRAKLMAKQQEDERKQKAVKAAEAKRAGSINVRKSGTPPTDSAVGTGSIDATLEAVYEQASNL